MQKLIALLGLALLTGGCAAGALTSSSSSSSLLDSINPSSSALEIHNQTDVKLTEGNFLTVKTNVVGQARGFALLGFITMVPARFQTAMDRLYAKAEVQTGKPQVLGNIIMEKTSAYWILFSIPRVSVRADVVEFVPSGGGAAIIIPRVRPSPDETPPGNPLQPQGDKSGAEKQL